MKIGDNMGNDKIIKGGDVAAVREEIMRLCKEYKNSVAFEYEIERVLSAVGDGYFRFSKDEQGNLLVTKWDVISNALLAQFTVDLRSLAEEKIKITGFWPMGEYKNHTITLDMAKEEGLTAQEITEVRDGRKSVIYSEVGLTAEQRKYDQDGVVVARDEVTFAPHQEDDLKDCFMFVEYHAEARKCLEDYSYEPTKAVVSRTHMERNALDIAQMATCTYTQGEGEELPSRDKEYVSKVSLSREAGLRNLIPVASEEPYPAEVIIPEITTAEIEAMIAEESDPRVQEGLRKWAQNRENMYYHSKEDPYFVRTGIDERSM